MIRSINLAALLLMAGISLGQTNFVPNGGFETGNGSATPGCTNYYSDGSNCGGILTNAPCRNRFNNDLAYWNVGDLNPGCLMCFGTPDWIDPDDCSSPVSCGLSYGGHGNNSRYVHMSSEVENMRVGLRKDGSSYTLIPGYTYIFEIRILAKHAGYLRVFFTEWGENWNSNSNNNDKWEATNANIHFNSDDLCEWTYVQRKFTVPYGDEYNELQNLVLRMSDDNPDGDYFQCLIDDVKLTLDAKCPETRYIQNYVHWDEHQFWQAEDTLIAGEDVTPYPFDPIGLVEVKYNSEIVYKAGTQIVLEPGFVTESGAYFEAVIDECLINPCPYPNLDDFIEICDGSSGNIGEPTEPGVIYEWSPASYLDDPNSSDPLFTPPPGSGTITYTVIMTTVCGDVIVDEVTVYYDDNPSTVPSVAITNVVSNDYSVGFDITVGSQTEVVTVAITNLTTGATEYIDHFYSGVDFACCTFPWQMPELWLTMCHDYRFEVTTKNICTEELASDSYDWIRNSTPALFVPNVFSPNGDGVNDELCITTNGVDLYDIYVTNNSGSYIYSASGEITSNTTCIWGGECTGSTCSGGCIGSPGTYFVIVNVYNCTSPAAVTETMAVFVSELDCGTVGMSLQTPDPEANISLNEDGETLALVTDIANPSEGSSFNIYPNPTPDGICVTYGGTFLLEVYALTGELLMNATYNNEAVLDLSGLSTGTYMVKVISDNEVFTERIIKE